MAAVFSSEDKMKLQDLLYSLKYENPSLAKVIFNYAFPKDIAEDDSRLADRLFETSYSDLSDKNLFQCFTKKYFNNCSDEQLENLFQEVYNRVADSNDEMRSYICKVTHEGPGLVASIGIEDNLISLNKDVLETAKKSMFGPFNQHNCASKFLLGVLHEIQHGNQFHSALNYALENKQTEDKDFMGALSLMLTSLQTYAFDNKDGNLFNKLDEQYWDAYEEFDADIYAIETVYNNFNNGVLKDYNTAWGLQSFTEEMLDIQTTVSPSELKKIIHSKKKRMEKIINEVCKDYRKYLNNDELSEKMLKTVEEFMKKENSKSKFDIYTDEKLDMINSVMLETKKYRKNNENELGY